MSYVCKRGYKCMCFQCGEKDCEHFESEPPKWVKDLFENEENKSIDIPGWLKWKADLIVERERRTDEIN